MFFFKGARAKKTNADESTHNKVTYGISQQWQQKQPESNPREPIDTKDEDTTEEEETFQEDNQQQVLVRLLKVLFV